MQTPLIRRAERADADSLLCLIAALADFENLAPPDDAARARLIEHGFGDRPKFEAYLAEVEDAPGPVGYAFIFETYSTFLAKPTLYLEDLFVLPDYRKRGVGKALLSHCIALAHERGCGRMEWTCLDWNVNAQKVYEESVGAKRMSEWYLYRLMIAD
ncbi:MAG: GNAT family N-acetyltransferase [Capsulimonas sp.]|uniref:GNAT family N-acetyltransferase n=1 Tax=Capsulimonas sp. TaxID=2494211 RepID=UPI0032644D8F